MRRGLYWNRSKVSSVTGGALAASSAFLREIQADTASLWLNDQPQAGAIHDRFRYSQDWTRATFAAFARHLLTDGFGVSAIFSPHIPSLGFIDSLKDPLALCAELGVTDIELDLEGNLTSVFGPQEGADFVPHAEAKARIVELIRSNLPDARIGLSSTRNHLKRHTDLLPSVNFVAPQAYGSANEIHKCAQALAEHHYAGEVRVALSAQKDTITPAQLQASLAAAQEVAGYSGTLIWARREVGDHPAAKAILEATAP